VSLAYLGREDLFRTLTMGSAIQAIKGYLESGFDPESEGQRVITDAPSGQMLFMPAVGNGYAGAKLITIAPRNADQGLPRIQGLYLLLDGPTLSPIALLDGSALTELRTPAVSALAIDRLARPDARRMVIFGTGPQAFGHLVAARLVRPIREVGIVGRTHDRAKEFIEANTHTTDGVTLEVATADAVESSDLIVCATNARTPLFRGDLVRAESLVVALGSHEPSAREVDTDLVARAVVTVESKNTALREAGDLIMAIRSGRTGKDCIVGNLADVMKGKIILPSGKPRLFKSVGMGWEDLAVASAAFESASFRGSARSRCEWIAERPDGVSAQTLGDDGRERLPGDGQMTARWRT
jgi:ornithine cyclodeaminase/alanine dehydrogenase-like protein (mu-crystallin family)